MLPNGFLICMAGIVVRHGTTAPVCAPDGTSGRSVSTNAVAHA
jgi:hypothetical protein